jgi:hypothetical protein
VIASVRERIEMRNGSAVRDLEDKLKEYRRVREQIAKYIDLMTRPFKNSGFTIGQILGKSIATNSCLATFSPETLERCKVPQSFLTASGLSLLQELGIRIEEAHQESAGAKPHWKPTRLVHPERFTIEEACDLAARASLAFSALAEARDRLADVWLPTEAANVDLSQVDAELEQAQRHLEANSRKLLLNLLDGDNVKTAQRFIERCESCRHQRDELSGVLAREPDEEGLELIRQIQEICDRFNLSTVDPQTLTEQLQEKRKFVQTVRNISSVLKPLVDARSESSAWPLSDIAKAHALLKETGRDAVLCRNARTNEPDAGHVLQSLCSEGKRLQAQKAELDNKVSFAVEAPVEALSECVSTLRVAGAFRIFSPRYHNAKRLFLSVTRTDKYHKQHAVSTLEALIDYRRKEAEFTNHPHVSALFGVQFRGIETQFEPFERLAKFYRGADAHFGHPQKKTLRTFLREAHVGELELLPAIPAIEVVITYDSMQERIQAAEAEIRTLEAAIASLRPRVHVFADPRSIEPADLSRLLDVMRSLIDEEAALDRCEEARSIFEVAFAGRRTANDALSAAISWACAAQGSRKVLLAVLSADRTSEARERIGEVLSAEILAENFLLKVATTAKIDACHFTKGCSHKEIAQRLDCAAEDADGLFSHALFATILDEVRPQGLLPLVEERLRKDAHV